MDAVIERFDQGVVELRLYLKLLQSIEARSTKLRFRPANADQCLRILKASTFLLMYNIVEFGVRAGFDSLYSDIKTKGVTYPEAIEELKHEWLAQAFRDVKPESATKDSYLNKTRSLLDHVSEATILSLSARKMSISGNLDADTVRGLCRKHKISLRVHHRAFGGAELSTVKDKRNALAHGHISFAECGREYSVADLDRIAKEVTSFVRGFLGSARLYQQRAQYRLSVLKVPGP